MKWGGVGVIAAVGLHHTDGLGPVHMLTEHYTSLSTSLCRAPPECTGAPEWNINDPNSICGSQSYFLDEQCRHFCVMDDEHAGIVCC